MRSDHFGFSHFGYQALMVTDTANFRYRHYHQEEDTVEKLDYESTATVVDGLVHVLRELATPTLQRAFRTTLLILGVVPNASRSFNIACFIALERPSLSLRG
jgi:hypothetical protein